MASDTIKLPPELIEALKDVMDDPYGVCVIISDLDGTVTETNKNGNKEGVRTSAAADGTVTETNEKGNNEGVRTSAAADGTVTETNEKGNNEGVRTSAAADGTVTETNEKGNPWDINLTPGVLAALSEAGKKGHASLVTSARAASDMERSDLGKVPHISFHGNAGLGVIEHRWHLRGEERSLSALGVLHEEMLGVVGNDDKVLPGMIGAFYGIQMWKDHERYGTIGEALQECVERVLGKDADKFNVVLKDEGHFVYPKNTPGKLAAAEAYLQRLQDRLVTEAKVRLTVVAGNGKNDRELVSRFGSGSSEGSFAFWVGNQEAPEGTRVTCLKDPNEWSGVLGAIGQMLPDRSKLWK